MAAAGKVLPSAAAEVGAAATAEAVLVSSSLPPNSVMYSTFTSNSGLVERDRDLSHVCSEIQRLYVYHDAGEWV